MSSDEHLGAMLTLALGALSFMFPRAFKLLLGMAFLIFFGLGFAR